MASETRAQRMADLARGLRSETDAAATMDHLVRATVDLVPGCEAAGITVAHRGGRIETPAASNDWPVHGAKLQADLEEGPCVDAAWNRSGSAAGTSPVTAGGRLGARGSPRTSAYAACCACSCSPTRTSWVR